VAEQLEPRPLSKDQIALLMGIVSDRARQLEPTARRIAERNVVSRREVGELIDVLFAEMCQEQNPRGGFTSRGDEIDNLIGVVYQWADDFFR
jgi:hypothetical protein